MGSVASDLLQTACTYDASGNLTLSVLNGEVGYLGLLGGVMTANAVNASGNVCTVAATGKKITIAGTGTAGNTEKFVFDFTNYAAANITDAITMTLDTSTAALSTVLVIAPSTGGNMALGATGLSIDTTRAKATLDVTMKWSTTAAVGNVQFQGGAGTNSFFADASSLPTAWPTTAPWGAITTWAAADTPKNLATAVGAAFTGPLTLQGGPANDILAGGAGLNTISGGPGDDWLFQGKNSHAEVLKGGDGFDTVDYSLRSNPVTATVGIDGAVTAVTIGGTMTGYKVGDVLTLVDTNHPAPVPATVKVTTIATGAITGVSVVSAGAGYTAGDTLASTDATTPAATGATFTAVTGTVTAGTVVSGGTGYAAGSTLTVGGAGAGATFKVATVTAGAVATVTQLTAGTGYSSGVTATTDSLAGTGCLLNVTATTMYDDGIAAEGDSIASDIENIIGGSGNDILDARSITTTSVMLQGGAGNDILRGGSKDDDLCGGPGSDLLQWSPVATGDHYSGSAGSGGGWVTGDVDEISYASAGASAIVCLDPAEVTTGGACQTAAQNGIAGALDVVNSTNAICPSARAFLVNCVGSGAIAYTFGGVDYVGACTTTTNATQIAAGSAGVVDIANLTGPSSNASTLDCFQNRPGGTSQYASAYVPCTVVGSNALAGDTFEGSPAADAIFGGGGADTVVTQGGADLVDLTHTTTSGACGGGCVVTVSCTSDATAAPVVLLETADDTKAGSSLGTGGAKCTDFIVE